MLSPIFQSSTLSIRRQATAFIRAAAVVGGNANPTTKSTTTYSTTAIRPASTSTSFVVSQLHITNNTNNSRRRWFSDTTGTGKTTTATEGTSEEDNDAVADEEDDTTTTAEEGETATAEDNENNENKEQVQKLKMELVDLKNQLLRSFAEQENIRTIARNDVKAAKDFSTKSFAKSMLEVADNLDRALESVTSPETTTETSSDTNNDTLKSFVEGIQLTNSGLLKALQSNGVEAYCEQPGDEFNPDKHQALMEYIDPTKSAGTIGVVMKKGYTLNKRVLRPAEVGVIKK